MIDDHICGVFPPPNLRMTPVLCVVLILFVLFNYIHYHYYCYYCIVFCVIVNAPASTNYIRGSTELNGGVIFRCVHKIFVKRLLASSCLSVSPSVRMEEPSSHSKDFHEILYSGIFPKFKEKIQVSLKSDKNKGYFA